MVRVNLVVLELWLTTRVGCHWKKSKNANVHVPVCTVCICTCTCTNTCLLHVGSGKVACEFLFCGVFNCYS